MRERGGLCIADEVQVGYGRLGEHFWGFEQQGVVPDVITIAKAMGNGHPLGAVITTRAIADAFAAEGSMFSSAGGSPVSCVVGMTVLDILEDEGLQENARVVGGALRAGLEELATRHDLIGAVHGLGSTSESSWCVHARRWSPPPPRPRPSATRCCARASSCSRPATTRTC